MSTTKSQTPTPAPLAARPCSAKWKAVRLTIYMGVLLWGFLTDPGRHTYLPGIGFVIWAALFPASLFVFWDLDDCVFGRAACLPNASPSAIPNTEGQHGT
jgi:hypothetical protein